MLASKPQSTKCAAPLPPATSQEPKIYISTATLVLAQRQLDDVYAWKTLVRTPTTPPLVEEQVLYAVVKKTQNEAIPKAEVGPSSTVDATTTIAAAEAAAAAAAAATAAAAAALTASEAAFAGHNNDLYTPANAHDEADNIYTRVLDFMSAERYHSDCNWLMSHTPVSHADGDMNSSRA